MCWDLIFHIMGSHFFSGPSHIPCKVWLPIHLFACLSRPKLSSIQLLVTCRQKIWARLKSEDLETCLTSRKHGMQLKPRGRGTEVPVLRSSVQGDPEANSCQVGIQQGNDLQGNSEKRFRPQLGEFRAQSTTWRNPLSHRNVGLWISPWGERLAYTQLLIIFPKCFLYFHLVEIY